MSSAEESKKPHVLVVGGGLAGMLFAQALRKQNISFEIFERDDGPFTRLQGWAISLHWIIKELLSVVPSDLPSLDTTSHFYPHDYTGDVRMWDATTGDEIMGIQDSEEKRFIRASRARLREWLSTNLGVQYSKKFTRYEETESGVKVFFEDGTSAKGDMLVAADGASSHVRNQLFSNTHNASIIPIGVIWGELTLNQQQNQAQFALGRSAYVSIDEGGQRIFAGLKALSEDDASAAVWYWAVAWPDENGARPDFWVRGASAEELHAAALERTKHFLPRFSEIIRVSGPKDMIVSPPDMRDLVPRRSPSGRVTLLGDAAHTMSPFRGEGGNHALQDAVVLGRLMAGAVVEGGEIGADKIQRVIEDYETEMLARTTEAVEKSRLATQYSADRNGYRWGVHDDAKVKGWNKATDV